MTISDVVQLITACAALFGAVGTTFNRSHIKQTQSDVANVHKAVNSTAQKQNRRTDQLTASLTEAGIDVPPRDPPDNDERKGTT